MRVILGKGNRMDNNELSTNLAEVGTDAASRKAVKELAYSQIRSMYCGVALKEQRETMLRIADNVIGLLAPVTSAQPATSCSEFPNNSDAISRQAAIDAVQNRHMMLSKEKVLLVNDLEKLPSAQPERAMGTWMPDTMCYYEERFICSECKGNYKVDTCMGNPMWNFCPNCGADMRGEQGWMT